MNLNIFDLESMNYQNILKIDVTIKLYQHAFLYKCKFE